MDWKYYFRMRLTEVVGVTIVIIFGLLIKDYLPNIDKYIWLYLIAVGVFMVIISVLVENKWGKRKE